MTSYSRFLISPKSLSSFPSGIILSKLLCKGSCIPNGSIFWGFLCNNYLILSKSSVPKISYSQQCKNLSSSAIGWQAISQDFLQIQWLVVTFPAKSSIHYYSQSESKLRQQSLQFIFATPIKDCILWLLVNQFAIPHRFPDSQGDFSPFGSLYLLCFASRIIHHYIASSNV